MVTFGEFPEIKITCTHGGIPYSLEGYHTDTQVILVENAVNQATVVATDTKGEVFLNKCDLNDIFTVDLRWLSKGPTWTRRFYGRVNDLTPIFTENGELVTIRARGSEESLLAMLVGEQYGSQSANPTLNTILEVLTDPVTNKGVIPRWVLKVLNTDTDSGYALNTTKIADLASDFKYLYWGYKPAINCLDDMLDLISAANAPNAGAHWIANYSDDTCYLCVATVGAHENPPADVWPTWWNTDQAGSTIEVAKDMIVSNFTKQRAKANYVLYHGRVIKPLDLDSWTENNAASWIDLTAGSVSDDPDGKVGAAIKITSNHTGGPAPELEIAVYPTTDNLNLNITNMGGKYDVPVFHVWAKIDAATYASNLGFWFIFRDSDNDYYSIGSYNSKEMFAGADRWTEFTLPIGPYWMEAMHAIPNWYNGPFAGMMTPQWSDIQQIGVTYYMEADNQNVWVDNWYISGSVMRGAKDAAKIASQKAIIQLIVDNVAKDDTCSTDDSGVMAQLAKAELYRSVTTPIIGEICIPGQETILPGQLAHIHFGKKNGTFNIDKDMRFTQVVDRFNLQGYFSYLTPTDDVKNSRPIQPHKGYNLILEATNPNFQNRERTSVKTRDIDITQPILEVNY